MKVARLVVDSRSTALSKSGDILLAIADGAITEADVDLELGDVVVDPRVGRHCDDDVTLFNSVGIGLQDLVTARLLVDRALANGVGTTVNLQT
jgi:ornithine cyclodeaminase/alanine dehydrogenase